MEILVYMLSGLFRRKQNRIIFGAWFGEKYADNSRYMMEFLKNRITEYELVWIGKECLKGELPQTSKFVIRNSISAIYYCLTSKYVFVTHSYFDVSSLNVFRGAKIIQLWHGIGIKNLEISSANSEDMFSRFRKRIRYIIRRYDYFICSSEMNKKRNLIAFKSYGISENNVINSGQPRNDILMKWNEQLKNKIKEKINYENGINIINKDVILYLPTFRKYGITPFSFSNIDNEKVRKLNLVLDKYNAVLLEKSHKVNKNQLSKVDVISNRIYNISACDNLDTQELLLSSDVLITDYSSCYLDYLLLDKPIIHFAYDLKDYMSLDQGFFYDFNKISAGDIVESFEKLLISLTKNLYNKEYKKSLRDSIRKTMMEYEKGNSCEIIARKLNLI